MATTFDDIPLILNQQSGGIHNGTSQVDVNNTLVLSFTSGLKTVVRINNWYYGIFKVTATSTYIPTLYISKDGLSWSKVLDLDSALTGDLTFNSISIDYDAPNTTIHFVYTADTGTVVYYNSYNIGTTTLGTKTTFTEPAFPPASITVNGTSEFIIVAPDDTSTANLFYEAFKDGAFVNGDLTAVPGSSEITGPNQPIVQYSKRDKLFHVLVGKRISNYLDWWTYNLQTDIWTKRPNPPFPDILAIAPNDPTGANAGQNFILSLVSDEYGYLHATVQETGTGIIYYSQYSGGGWGDSEVVYSGTDGNLNGSVGVQGIKQFFSAVDGTTLNLFERTEADRFESITNTLTVTSNTGVTFGAVFRDRLLSTAFEPEEVLRAAYHELTIEEQTTFSKIFQWFDQNDVAIDATLYDFELEMKEEPGGTVIDTYSTAESHIVTATTGKVTITAGADETEGLNFGAAIYSLKAYLRTGAAIVESGSWTSTTLINSGGVGTILANGGTPFSGLSNDDYISVTITSLLFTEFAGIYKIDTVTDTLITLTSAFSPVGGVAGSSDISIYELDPDNFYRVAEGPVQLSRDATIIP